MAREKNVKNNVRKLKARMSALKKGATKGKAVPPAKSAGAKAKEQAEYDAEFTFHSTAEIPVPDKLIDWIIGQERGSHIIKKAAAQRRNVLLVGQPGTGKSMLAQAMAELMPAEEMEDILIYPNPNDENQPVVRSVKTYPKELIMKYLKEKTPLNLRAGNGRVIVEGERMKGRMRGGGLSLR